MARSLCILAFLLTKILAEEFIFSANLAFKNSIITYQSINIKKPEINLKGIKFSYLCDITLDKEYKTDEFLNLYKSELLDCFMLHRVMVKNIFIKDKQNVTKEINVQVLPTRFTIKFKPNSAIIEVISKR